MLQRRVSPAKKYLRRTLQVVALVGTLLVGIVALALIVSQTPWFRDWLRKFVVRQAGQYVNGTVSIGSLGGNLFYGVQLGDVAVDVNGEHIVTLKNVEVKYSIGELVSKGVTVSGIRLERPFVLLRHDRNGWNIASLVKRQQQEANRQGPRKPISLPDIEIVDGSAAIEDTAPANNYRLPSRIDGLNVKAGFEYAPVHYSVTLDSFSFTGKAPDLAVQKLTGRFGTRDDDLNFEKMFLQTAQSSVTFDGAVQHYLANPSLQVTVSSPWLSLPEFAGVVPPLQGYNLHPRFDVKASGPQNNLQLSFNVTSEAGGAHGMLTTDAKAPDLNARGSASLESLNLAPIVKDPAQKSDITGSARFDVRLAGNPTPPAAALDRLRGHVAFDGPKVVAAGYAASNVKASADIEGRRIGLDARANAYGGSATAKGSLTIAGPTGQPFLLDLAGRASHINLADLPRSTNAPRITTNLNASAYHVKGTIARTTSVEGSATLEESTLAGGTIMSGTSGEFTLSSTRGRRGLDSLTYAARGEVHDLNVKSVGEAFQIAAFARPEYDSRIDATFDVHGSGTENMRKTSVEGSATLGQSTFAGATILKGTAAELALTSTTGTAGLDSLTYAARGEVRDLNLKTVGDTFQIAALARPEYDSRLNTTFDVKGSGTTVDTMQVDATGTATDSQIFGGTVPRMAYEAHLANDSLKGRANGSFENFDPGRVAANPRYAGHVSGTVDASFGLANLSAPITPAAITADGRVTLAGSEVAGLKIDSADIQGQYADRRGDIRQATVKGPDITVQASGPIALDQAGQSNVKYHVAATNLESLGKLANQPGLRGAATLDGTLTGNASSLKIEGALDGSNLGYQDNKALDLNSKYSVTVPDLDFVRARVQADTNGTFVQIGGVQINVVTATTTYAEKNLEFQAHLAQSPGGPAEKAAGGAGGGSRELDASGSVIFHPDHKELHLPNFAMRTRGVEWRSAPGSTATIQYGSDRIQIQNIRLVNADQVLNVDGSFSLGENPELGGIQAHAENVDIAQLEKLALMNRGFTGRLNADAKIEGSARAPNVSGHLTVTNGGFQQFKYESLTADGSFVNQRIAVDAKLVQGPGVELTAKGSVPLSALKPNPPGVTGHVAASDADAIDLRIQSSRVDLGIVQSFTTQLTDVTGTVQADVRVTGSGQDPHLDGYVDIQNGGFAVAQAGTRFSGMTTRVDLKTDRISVARFQVLDQHGNPLTIQGDLAIHERQAGAVNMSIDSDNFKLLDNELGNVHVETHLKLTGEVRKPRLEGELRADAARLEVDKILLQFSDPYSEEALPDVISAQETTTTDKGADQATRDALERGRQIRAENAPRQNATAPEAPSPKTGIFSALAMDVHVVAPDNMVLRGNDIRPGGATSAQVGNVNATIGADLEVTKNVDGPITLRGTANTVRGFYEFQGRKFTIQRDGTVRFTGLPEINPDLNISAERLIPNTGVTARIQVTGTARAPQIALSSTPPLDEADILSLIVFNRSVNELGTGERASLAETAGGIASGFVASSLGRSIGKALDVDLFEITTSDVDTGQTAGGFTLGKQVSDKAFVRLRQQFGQRSFTEFMLEYQLAKFLRAETRFAPETSGVANRLTQRRVERAGIDLIFFFSY